MFVIMASHPKVEAREIAAFDGWVAWPVCCLLRSFGIRVEVMLPGGVWQVFP
jgi:hypothetical protein